MIEGLLTDGPDPARLADLARGRLREKLTELERALTGRVGPHQRFLLAQQLAHIDYLDAAIERISDEIAERLRPFDDTLTRLETIPGVGRRVAEIVAAELGLEVARFPSAAHLAAWVGLAPGNHESAGKRLSGTTRKGSPWLRTTLVEAAQAAARTKDTYLVAQYRRLAPRRGQKRAVVAVAHTIVVIISHLLRDQTTYRELGATDFDERDRQDVERRLVRHLEALGNTVSLTPKDPAAGPRRCFQTSYGQRIGTAHRHVADGVDGEAGAARRGGGAWDPVGPVVGVGRRHAVSDSRRTVADRVVAVRRGAERAARGRGQPVQRVVGVGQRLGRSGRGRAVREAAGRHRGRVASPGGPAGPCRTRPDRPLLTRPRLARPRR